MTLDFCIQSIIDQTYPIVTKALDFCTGEVIYSTIIFAGALALGGCAVVFLFRRRGIQASLINRAHDKQAHERTVIRLRKKSKVRVKMVGTSSAQKKFILVPHDEYREFIEYKKRRQAGHVFPAQSQGN